MLDGFEVCWTAQPLAGVFDFVGIHGKALSILFGYTVIEARILGEGVSTSSAVLVSCRQNAGRRDVAGKSLSAV
jgi:hypothetical protein